MVPQRAGPVHSAPAAAGALGRIAAFAAPGLAMTTPLTYRDAGVDIDAGNEVVERIKPLVKRSFRPEVMGGLGGFGALFDLSGKYKEPVLVSGTDGVGTKLKLAQQLNRHDTIGIDLVAMCANDIAVAGAEPLFFLDYYATGKLDVDTAATVIQGIADGCALAGCALVGGETAEMPGMYEGADYDLAGFCVGIVEKERIIDGSRVAPGDVLIGLASSGPHSNGYSLIRRILAVTGTSLDEPFAGTTLGRALLAPTRIYVPAMLKLLENIDVHSFAHITGGGLPDNLPRVLADGTRAVIDAASWQRPEIFRWLQQQGGVIESEMYRTFNCGVGMVVCVAPADVETTLASLAASGETAWVMGRIEAAGDDAQPRVEIR